LSRIFLAMGILLISFQSLHAAECRLQTPSQFEKQRNQWAGRTLIAFASWCSSCKDNILSAQGNPEKFVFLVAFDEAEAGQKVLDKYKITSPCLAGEELVNKLAIKGLPWSMSL
jgi:hypothetical protein